MSNKSTAGAKNRREGPLTLKIPIANTVFTCLTKLSQAQPTPNILLNTDLQTLHFLMRYSDGLLEMPQEVIRPRLNGNASEGRNLRIGVERCGSDNGSVDVVLHAPSMVELYAVAEAFMHRLTV